MENIILIVAVLIGLIFAMGMSDAEAMRHCLVEHSQAVCDHELGR